MIAEDISCCNAAWELCFAGFEKRWGIIIRADEREQRDKSGSAAMVERWLCEREDVDVDAGWF